MTAKTGQPASAVSRKEAQESRAWPYSLLDGGILPTMICQHDWAKTALGPIKDWPQHLRATVNMALANSFPMAIIWGDEFLQIYNDAFIPIAGHNHPSMLGNHIWNTWAEIWPGILEPAISSVKETGRAIYTPNQHFPVLRFGFMEEVYCLLAYSPLRNDAGECDGVLITISETTGQVLGERRLKTLRDLGTKTSEARTPQETCELVKSTLEESAVDVPFALIYLIDESGQTANLSCAAGLPAGTPVSPERIALQPPKFPEHPVMGHWPLWKVMTAGPQYIDNLADCFVPITAGPWPEAIRQAVILPVNSQTGDHPVGFLVAGVSPRLVFDENYQEFLGLVTSQIATGIASARAHEAERQRAEALAALDQAKTDFFSNVSHELRTPLTLILGPLEDILSDGRLVGNDRAQLDVAYRNALRLLKLVNSLLDFSRLEAGRLRASFRPTDLSALTAELASNFRAATEKAGLALYVNCPRLPEAIYVDRDLWEKIVLNLLSNAFKHTFEGEIIVDLQWQDSQAILSVRDTGVGIAQEQIPHLFERFHRVSNARSRTHEGTGIGLALVRELVKLHGGSIQVQSVPDQGSAFTVTIPTGLAHLPSDQVETETGLASTEIGSQSFIEEALRWLPEDASHAVTPAADATGQTLRGTIVLADDNADMLGYIRRLLEPHHAVQVYPDGLSALKAIEENLPDLVLTDIMMPQLDGFGLLRQLRENPRTRTLPVIMLSARAGEEANIEGLQAGADDYLVKPFSANELLARVQTHLKLARLRRDTDERFRELAKMKAVGKLAGGLAHDFNSLLTVLLGRLEMLDEHVEDIAGKRLLDSAFSVTQRSALLVRQLLAFASLQPLCLEARNLNDLLSAQEESIVAMLGSECRLVWQLDASLQEALLDVHEMENMLRGLVLNACDAMPDGGTLVIGTRNVHLDTPPEGLPAADYVMLFVADTGVGMAPEVLSQAFEPFFTTKGVRGGSGLGLSQLYGTVKQLGGTVALRSEPGEGTLVEILLPTIPPGSTP